MYQPRGTHTSTLAARGTVRLRRSPSGGTIIHVMGHVKSGNEVLDSRALEDVGPALEAEGLVVVYDR